MLLLQKVFYDLNSFLNMYSCYFMEQFTMELLLSPFCASKKWTQRNKIIVCSRKHNCNETRFTFKTADIMCVEKVAKKPYFCWTPSIFHFCKFCFKGEEGVPFFLKQPLKKMCKDIPGKCCIVLKNI